MSEHDSITFFTFFTFCTVLYIRWYPYSRTSGAIWNEVSKVDRVEYLIEYRILYLGGIDLDEYLIEYRILYLGGIKNQVKAPKST